MAVKRTVMTQKEIDRIVHDAPWAIFSMIDQNLRPYAVPLNYAVDPESGDLYCHMAKHGRKMAAFKAHPAVHITIVSYDRLVEDAFVTHYDAVMLEGSVSFVDDPEEKRRILRLLCDERAPSQKARRDETIEAQLKSVAVMRVAIEKRSGKTNRDT